MFSVPPRFTSRKFISIQVHPAEIYSVTLNHDHTIYILMT